MIFALFSRKFYYNFLKTPFFQTLSLPAMHSLPGVSFLAR